MDPYGSIIVALTKIKTLLILYYLPERAGPVGWKMFDPPRQPKFAKFRVVFCAKKFLSKLV